jgi:hypothetical protein
VAAVTVIDKAVCVHKHSSQGVFDDEAKIRVFVSDAGDWSHSVLGQLRLQYPFCLEGVFK